MDFIPLAISQKWAPNHQLAYRYHHNMVSLTEDALIRTKSAVKATFGLILVLPLWSWYQLKGDAFHTAARTKWSPITRIYLHYQGFKHEIRGCKKFCNTVAKLNICSNLRWTFTPARAAAAAYQQDVRKIIMRISDKALDIILAVATAIGALTAVACTNSVGVLALKMIGGGVLARFVTDRALKVLAQY
ncbi:MAG: hypothetical protein Q8K75_04260 [Chlamydiales bacterium]|nr:hypothetical protein [Chlamydiales bacterium]